jgi:hypothetical protein
MDKAVFGIAKTDAQAVAIANALKTAGFANSDVSVLFPDKEGTRDFAHEQHTKAPEGAATGASTGAVLGGAFGWIVGIGALAIPGLGPFIAAGPSHRRCRRRVDWHGHPRIRSQALRGQSERRQYSAVRPYRRRQRASTSEANFHRRWRGRYLLHR